MAGGSLKTEPLMTYSEPLERWQEAFEAAERATDLVKIAVTPNGETL
jgi:threonine dehydrogenase-like Zn-dependent dehydrogenase